MTSHPLRSQLRSVQLVPLTAFDQDEQLNLEPMRELWQRFYEAGIRVMIPCAGSAEFHSVTSNEIIEVVRMTRETLGDDVRVITPIGHQLSEAISLGKRAAAEGSDGVLIMPLGFPYLSNEGVREYYVRILDALPIPCLIYKKGPIPSDDLLLDLADHPNLIGVKYAVNDMDAFTRVVQADGDRIDWYCGSAERFAPFFALAGSPGYTSGAGNIAPRTTLALHAALEARDYAEAMRLQQILLPIEHYRARADNSFNITFLKHAIKQTGLDLGQPRPPQRRVTADEGREIDALVKPILQAETELSPVGS